MKIRLLLFFAALRLGAQSLPPFERTEDVVYGRKLGMALTMDVFRPKQANGYGIVLPVSASFLSNKRMIQPLLFEELLARGYTVFAVLPSSGPKFFLTEMAADVHRAVRYIRANASQFAVNADKLGSTGYSAGCHLALMLATQSSVGALDSKDPVDQAGSRIQATACFFPPTDFLNWGMPGLNVMGLGQLSWFKDLLGAKFDSLETRNEIGKEISPIYQLSERMPPVLLAHGDADALVPLQQSRSFIERAKELKVDAKLIVLPGKPHGWRGIEKDMGPLADWFDQYLRGGAQKANGN